MRERLPGVVRLRTAVLEVPRPHVRLRADRDHGDRLEKRLRRRKLRTQSRRDRVFESQGRGPRDSPPAARRGPETAGDLAPRPARSRILPAHSPRLAPAPEQGRDLRHEVAARALPHLRRGHGLEHLQRRGAGTVERRLLQRRRGIRTRVHASGQAADPRETARLPRARLRHPQGRARLSRRNREHARGHDLVLPGAGDGDRDLAGDRRRRRRRGRRRRGADDRHRTHRRAEVFRALRRGAEEPAGPRPPAGLLPGRVRPSSPRASRPSSETSTRSSRKRCRIRTRCW